MKILVKSAEFSFDETGEGTFTLTGVHVAREEAPAPRDVRGWLGVFRELTTGVTCSTRWVADQAGVPQKTAWLALSRDVSPLCGLAPERLVTKTKQGKRRAWKRGPDAAQALAALELAALPPVTGNETAP